MTPSEVFLELLKGAQAELDEGFGGTHHLEQAGDALPERGAAVLAEAARRMWDNYPYASPLYAGQMLKPPHVVARAAYAMAMGVNPNNHALDGGRASSAMEVEAVAEIAGMFGFESHLGHLTSSGTFANLEALWVAGQVMRAADGGLAGGKAGRGKAGRGKAGAIAASTQAHYTHARISGVLGLPFVGIGVDARNRMDLGKLEEALKTGEIGTVVVTLGTTATGAVDPLDEVLELRARHGFRVHVDAAYGGYFVLLAGMGEGAEEHTPGAKARFSAQQNRPKAEALGHLEAGGGNGAAEVFGGLGVEAGAAFDAIGRADSVVVDPHKHGLQPYGCGCVLFADRAVGRLYKHDSPYTYFTSGELHLGEISLECSRAGAAAVALWSTQRLMPLVRGGEFAAGLGRCRAAALKLYELLGAAPPFVVPEAGPELDIVVWACVGATVEESSERAQRVFDAAAGLGLHLALAKLPVAMFAAGMWKSGATVTCLRSVLMKWEHVDWVERIRELVLEAASS